MGRGGELGCTPQPSVPRPLLHILSPPWFLQEEYCQQLLAHDWLSCQRSMATKKLGEGAKQPSFGMIPSGKQDVQSEIRREMNNDGKDLEKKSA